MSKRKPELLNTIFEKLGNIRTAGQGIVREQQTAKSPQFAASGTMKDSMSYNKKDLQQRANVQSS